MGKILILEGEDFSSNPNAINIDEIPAVTDGLVGLYTGVGSTSDDNGIVVMPSIFAQGPDMTRITGVSRSIVYFAGSTIFRGYVLRSASSASTVAPGLQARLDLNFVTGMSFTAMANFTDNSTSANNRVLWAIESQLLQFRTSCSDPNNQLAIGGSNFNVGYGGRAPRAEAITVVITKSAFKIYVNGALVSNTNIAAAGLPDSLTANVIYGSNWAGSAPQLSTQTKVIQIHNRELSLAEIQAVHAPLLNLLA